MATRQKKSNPFSAMVIPFFCLLVTGYFGFHAFQGEYGVRSRSAMDRRLLQLHLEIQHLSRIHREMEQKIELLRDGKVEKDMLDRQARHVLGLVRENEFVVFFQEKS